jgi:hypothetical protein
MKPGAVGLGLFAGGTSASYQMAGPPYGLTVDIGGILFETGDSPARVSSPDVNAKK